MLCWLQPLSISAGGCFPWFQQAVAEEQATPDCVSAFATWWTSAFLVVLLVAPKRAMRSPNDLAVVHTLMGLCDAQIGRLISDAMDRVGRQGVITMEESRTAEDNLYVVEGMQFERGYISPYFVTDPERMVRLFAALRLNKVSQLSL